MSFGHTIEYSSYSSEEENFHKALLEAEKNKSNIAEVDKPFSYDAEENIGQVFHWVVLNGYKKKNYTPQTNKKRLKYYWEVDKIIDDKFKKGTDLSKGRSSSDLIKTGKIIFKRIKGNYLKNKEKVIFQQDMMNVIHEASMGLLKEGKYVIKEDGDYGHVKRIYIKEIIDSELTYKDVRKNPHTREIMQDALYVEYEYESEKRIDSKDIKFDGKEELPLKEFLEKWNVIGDEQLLKFEKKLNNYEDIQELPQFQDVLLLGENNDANEINEATTTAIMGADSKKYLKSVHDKIGVRKNEAQIIKYGFNRIVQIKKEELETILNAKKGQLEVMRQQLNETLTIFKKQMSKINRLIATLEIYLGVHEHIIQIAEGEPSDIKDPIHLRQMQLYMDEEFGDVINQGLDFSGIEEFEKWLIDTESYKKLVPEQKCIVIMRPRRYMKDRTGLHPILQGRYEAWDKRMYVLVRNGNNLYRIWSDHIKFQDRLFPKKAELQDMMNEMLKLQAEREETESSDEYDKLTEQMDTLEQNLFYYKRNILLIQGIIMRTQIFAPLPAGLNILDVKTHKDYIKFIYDDEPTLPDGRLRFWDWHKKINEAIDYGSRIIFTPKIPPNNYPKCDSRFDKRFDFDRERPIYPNEPTEGVYTLGKYIDTRWKIKKVPNPKFNPDESEGYDNKREISAKNEHGNYIKEYSHTYYMTIKYNPGGEIINWWDSCDAGHERKNNLSYKVFKEDQNILNYDLIDLDDVEFYINSRVDRSNYLNMLPLLWAIKKLRLKELQWEKEFVRMVKEEMQRQGIKNDNIEQMIWDCIEWWKNKVKWKRPITQDDEKALRMIKKRIKKSTQ